MLLCYVCISDFDVSTACEINEQQITIRREVKEKEGDVDEKRRNLRSSEVLQDNLAFQPVLKH